MADRYANFANSGLGRSMVKEGRPLDFARADAVCAARLARPEVEGVMERLGLERAVARVGIRWKAGEWADVVCRD